MWTRLGTLRAWRTMDVAVFCGVQIHVPERSDHVLSTGAGQGRRRVRQFSL
ncbi:MAG: hypothetical protein H6515_08620 [Microthrixaceae bacterium]|nr:hypothetical protein [Microthrixaceae bacterium]